MQSLQALDNVLCRSIHCFRAACQPSIHPPLLCSVVCGQLPHIRELKKCLRRAADVACTTTASRRLCANCLHLWVRTRERFVADASRRRCAESKILSSTRARSGTARELRSRPQGNALPMLYPSAPFENCPRSTMQAHYADCEMATAAYHGAIPQNIVQDQPFASRASTSLSVNITPAFPDHSAFICPMLSARN